jgi:hypothetical protein
MWGGSAGVSSGFPSPFGNGGARPAARYPSQLSALSQRFPGLFNKNRQQSASAVSPLAFSGYASSMRPSASSGFAPSKLFGSGSEFGSSDYPEADGSMNGDADIQDADPSDSSQGFAGFNSGFPASNKFSGYSEFPGESGYQSENNPWGGASSSFNRRPSVAAGSSAFHPTRFGVGGGSNRFTNGGFPIRGISSSSNNNRFAGSNSGIAALFGGGAGSSRYPTRNTGFSSAFGMGGSQQEQEQDQNQEQDIDSDYASGFPSTNKFAGFSGFGGGVSNNINKSPFRRPQTSSSSSLFNKPTRRFPSPSWGGNGVQDDADSGYSSASGSGSSSGFPAGFESLFGGGGGGGASKYQQQQQASNLFGSALNFPWGGKGNKVKSVKMHQQQSSQPQQSANDVEEPDYSEGGNNINNNEDQFADLFANQQSSTNTNQKLADLFGLGSGSVSGASGSENNNNNNEEVNNDDPSDAAEIVQAEPVPEFPENLFGSFGQGFSGFSKGNKGSRNPFTKSVASSKIKKMQQQAVQQQQPQEEDNYADYMKAFTNMADFWRAGGGVGNTNAGINPFSGYPHPPKVGQGKMTNFNKNKQQKQQQIQNNQNRQQRVSPTNTRTNLIRNKRRSRLISYFNNN